MGVNEDSAGEFEFITVFLVQPGEYQYKFRLGPGDWWVCDEDQEIVDDGLGNRNNLISVPEPSVSRPALQQHPSSNTPAGPSQQSDKRPEEFSNHVDAEEHRAPLLPHEAAFGQARLQLPQEDVPVQTSKPRQDTIALPDNNDPEDDYNPGDYPAAPLFRHETGSFITAGQYDHTPGVDEDEEHSDEAQPFPSLDSIRSEQASLLTHETGSTAKSSPRTSRSSSSNRPVVPEVAGPNDRNLYHFPTSHVGIMGQIRRLSNRLPEDITTDESLASPTSSSPLLRTTSQSPSLPSVLEDDGEVPLDAHHALSSRPAALITPPKTPEVENGPSKAYVSSHHHPKVAELDMEEEAKHPVSLPHLTHLQEDWPGDAPVNDESLTNEPTIEAIATQNDALATESKAPTGSSWEAMLGLFLLVSIGAFAAWLAKRVHGFGFTAKDGGATIVD